MMTKAMISIGLIAAVLASGSVKAEDQPLDRYRAIAVSAPLITQIYTNPELSEMRDVEISPDNQIKLYENLDDDICKYLQELFKDSIKVLCYGEIINRLKNIDEWNEFNHYFNGQNHVSPENCARFAGQLKVDGVLNSYLMFSYYEDSKKNRQLEVHFEWYLIDLVTGESVLDDKYDCQEKLKHDEWDVESEYKCFLGIPGSLGKMVKER